MNSVEGYYETRQTILNALEASNTGDSGNGFSKEDQSKYLEALLDTEYVIFPEALFTNASTSEQLRNR